LFSNVGKFLVRSCTVTAVCQLSCAIYLYFILVFIQTVLVFIGLSFAAYWSHAVCVWPHGKRSISGLHSHLYIWAITEHRIVWCKEDFFLCRVSCACWIVCELCIFVTN